MRDLLSAGLRVAEAAIEAGGGPAVVAAAGRQDLPGELVLRDVRRHLLANPFVVLVSADLADEPLIAAEPVGPLERPPGGEGGAVEQFVDESIALVRIVVGEEAAHVIGGRQLSGHVERGAAEEFRVGTQVGRLDPHLPQFGEDQLVDGIIFRRVAPNKLRGRR